jgi:hypothetical protein
VVARSRLQLRLAGQATCANRMLARPHRIVLPASSPSPVLQIWKRSYLLPPNQLSPRTNPSMPVTLPPLSGCLAFAVTQPVEAEVNKTPLDQCAGGVVAVGVCMTGQLATPERASGGG